MYNPTSLHLPPDDTIWGVEAALAMLNELQLAHTEVRARPHVPPSVAWHAKRQLPYRYPTEQCVRPCRVPYCYRTRFSHGTRI